MDQETENSVAADPKDTVSNTAESPKSSLKSRLKFAFRVGVFIATFSAIGYLIYKSWGNLAENPIPLDQIGYGWWLLAVVSFVSAMGLSSFFWHIVLLAMGQRPFWLDSLVAFFTSQLGKYIPGKAMVIVIRTDMITGKNVLLKPAIASVFVETLTWIFIGSVIASLLLLTQFQDQWLLQVAAVVMMLVAGGFTWPPLFSKIASKLSSLSGDESSNQYFEGVKLGTMAKGWCIMGVAWLLNGLSLWLVLKGIPGAEVNLSSYSLALACVSLATVAGFVSLMPGGIGVRELVMIPLLGPEIGPAKAIIAAVVIRLVWLGSTLASAGIIYLWRKLKA